MSPLTTATPLHALARLAKALGDPHRLRALMALRSGELCLCALISLLRLAPSTVSKHMQLLEDTGLVSSRKSGRWVHYRLAGSNAPAHLRSILRAISLPLRSDPAVIHDLKHLARIRHLDTRKLAQCYRKHS
ncbi:MAG: metalloregulator ArsR/SmtB family transcription factor [bacterium]|nr:metalloregulator ArsR/SmtB family transcription factor [bacterium]